MRRSSLQATQEVLVARPTIPAALLVKGEIVVAT